MGLGAGCKGCGESLQAEVEAKQESGEDLTEEEERILQADDPNDVVPTVFGIPAYGRLSSYDGVHCGFCEKVGYGLSVLFTGGFYVGVDSYTSWASSTVATSAFLVLAIQLLMVALFGRYLLIGPVVGPIVEQVAAEYFGIYLTEKAKREYPSTDGKQPTATDGGADVLTSNTSTTDDPTPDFDSTSDSVDLPESALDSVRDKARKKIQEYQRKTEALQEQLSEERSEKIEYKNDLQEKNQKLQSLQQEKQQTKQEAQKKEEKLDKARDRINKLSDFGHTRSGDRIPVVYHHSKGGKVGQLWLVKTVEIHLERDDYYGTAEFAFCTEKAEEQLPSELQGNVPDTMNENQMKQWSDYIYPDPERVSNPAKFVHMGKKGYPDVDLESQPMEEYPEVLFHENLARVREIRKEIDQPDVENGVTQSVLTLAYDEQDQFVAPPYDARGFGSVQEYREKARQRYRKMQRLQNKLDHKQEHIEDLQHELKLLKDEVDMKESFLDDARRQQREATQAAMTAEHTQESERRNTEVLKRQKQTYKNVADRSMKAAQTERERRLEERAEGHGVVNDYEEMKDEQQMLLDFVSAISTLGWQPDHHDGWDYDRVHDERDFAEMREIVNEYREENNDKLAKKIEGQVVSDIGGEA